MLAIIGAASFVFHYIGVNLFFAGLHSYAGISAMRIRAAGHRTTARRRAAMPMSPS